MGVKVRFRRKKMKWSLDCSEEEFAFRAYCGFLWINNPLYGPLLEVNNPLFEPEFMMNNPLFSLFGPGFYMYKASFYIDSAITIANLILI
ncbi:MAG: hypothetical protein ACJA01_001176 [Saprospiraceae bacterium]|jgi:hypothetical protein